MDLKMFYKEMGQATDLEANIKELASQPAFQNQKVRIMPDAHGGRFSIVGFTSTIEDKIMPALIGADIGCGVTGCKLNVRLEDIQQHLPKLEEMIRKFVPTGSKYHKDHAEAIMDKLYGKKAKVYIEKLKCYNHLRDKEKIELGVGTMGGNNHFMEIGVDKESNIWLFTHSGSRRLGGEVYKYYYDLAVSECLGHNKQKKEQEAYIQELKNKGLEQEINDKLKEFRLSWSSKQKHTSKELSYLTNKLSRDYKHDIEIVKKYALYNREEILEYMKMAIEFTLEKQTTIISAIDTAHNCIENGVVRKGAIYAPKNKKLLIPLNMKDGIIIGVGKGNSDWNYSAPHGAGRLYSRSKASQLLKNRMEEYQTMMKGVCSTSVTKNTLEESPMAYKPSEYIIQSLKDTVDILEIVKPILNIKDLNKKLDFKELRKIKKEGRS